VTQGFRGDSKIEKSYLGRPEKYSNSRVIRLCEFEYFRIFPQSRYAIRMSSLSIIESCDRFIRIFQGRRLCARPRSPSIADAGQSRLGPRLRPRIQKGDLRSMVFNPQVQKGESKRKRLRANCLWGKMHASRSSEALKRLKITSLPS
jgi:hypothetical protein